MLKVHRTRELIRWCVAFVLFLVIDLHLASPTLPVLAEDESTINMGRVLVLPKRVRLSRLREQIKI